VSAAAIPTALSFVYIVSPMLIIDFFIISLVIFLVELCIELCRFAIELCWLAFLGYCSDCWSQLITYAFKCRCWVEQCKPAFLYTSAYINKRVLKVMVSLVCLWQSSLDLL
jgi:hypothetical protein